MLEAENFYLINKQYVYIGCIRTIKWYYIADDDSDGCWYSEAVDDFAKQSNIQADFQVAPNRHSIAARLSLVWANADLDMIISLVDTCALQLELAAAWNLPIFTAGCSEPLEVLYENSLYRTHIRLDPTWRTLEAYISSLLTFVNADAHPVLLQPSAPESETLARNLFRRGVVNQICRSCLLDSNDQVLVILGNSADVVSSWQRVASRHWSSVILVSNESLTVVQAGLDEIMCFDEKGWALGAYTSWHYRAESCQGAGGPNFYKLASFKHTGDTRKAQMVWCNETRALYSSWREDSGEDAATRQDKATMSALYVVIGILVLIILVCVAGFIWWVYRKYSRNNHYSGGKPSWQISSKDIALFECDANQELDGETSSLYLQTRQPFVTDSDKLNADKETTTDFGYFKEQPVGFKKIVIKDFQLSKRNQKELEIMVGTHHENIATFYGASVKSSYIMLVTQYCIKGSLEEIFLFEPVHIDETFVSSIVMDILRGLKYIHKTSPIGVHGNLKSSNCLVTGRWVVKLSGFGLTDIRAKCRKERDYLWCAPEVIKKTQQASQKADIYSFGIILYEVIGKQGPFGRGYNYCDDQLEEVLERVCGFGYHPETSWLCCEDYLKNVMLLCWQSSPKLRPDFQTLSNQLKPFHAIMNGRSIVDNMLVMMERYQMRLEDLVEEKTAQLQLEKRKTENILHRMLPPQVASQLISGKKVLPENYSCITVLLSDICDFTALASSATPIQVVQLLNDLYTLFDSIIKNYDVYKVETVGDAYLCVSGLPRPNGDRHAVEIALMALEFVRSLKTFKIRHAINAKHHVQIRIGIHSGQCVAAVVGVSMPKYTLFGDTINVASHLESTGEPMKIQISQQTKNLLDKQEGQFVCEKRGMIDVKGKGEVTTWWLESSVVLPQRDNSKPALAPLDSLPLPITSDKRVSTVSSDFDMLIMPELSRSRSNSIKSQNSSSKSSQVFQRAGSFRHKIKCDSLSSYQISEGNIGKLGVSTAPNFEPIHDDNASCRLLSNPKHLSHSPIVIQIDEPC
ncbi:receptor-type guanylate cyclase Gyc76C-like [Watersipora subatra]|uniref:receptor-type guanylate cyclase Gyc76C-like n=1 Tax=Watersipora subatra TaxID=2589382 RepID=UPI00355BB591